MRTYKDYKIVNLEPPVYELLRRIKDEVKEASGLNPTLGQIVGRGLQCLADAQGRGAWLSPSEAAPQFEQRYRREVANLFSQFVARAMPETELKHIDVNRSENRLTVCLSDGSEYKLFCVKEDIASPMETRASGLS